jgi:hypothetical protein
VETLQDELTKKIRDKIIELFGPESALAQAMEDEGFMDKLADLVAFIYGLVMLSQPRPEPMYPKTYHPITTPDWAKKWQRPMTAAPSWWTGITTNSAFSAMSEYWG